MKLRTLSIAAACLGLVFVVVGIYPGLTSGRMTKAIEPVTVTRRLTTDAEIAAVTKWMNDPENIRFTKNVTTFSCHPKGMKVSSEGGWVGVAAAADLIDKRDGFRYRWMLNVYEVESKQRVVHFNYDQQIFSVPSHEAQPTFTDRVQLQPGDYRVEVVLHRIPGGFDLSQLEDASVDRSHRAIWFSRNVTVAPVDH